MSGFLLGLDLEGALQVTHSVPFPLPADSNNSDDAISPKSNANAKYQNEMIEELKAVNVDSNAVGYYISTYLGKFYNQSIVDYSLGFQLSNPNSIVLVHGLF